VLEPVQEKPARRAVQVLDPPVFSQVASRWWWYKSEFDSADWASGANEMGAARYVGLVANDNKSRWRVLAFNSSQIWRRIVGGSTECESERLEANVKSDKLRGPT